MINLDSLLKSRDTTSPTNVHLVKAMVFPMVMYGCESWTVKKAEHQRIEAFELWFWRRLLRVPWTARRSNQFILKEISPGISLEGMMLKLKLHTLATSCEELTHWKRLWCWEGLRAGGEGDDRGWDGWHHWLSDWTDLPLGSLPWLPHQVALPCVPTAICPALGITNCNHQSIWSAPSTGAQLCEGELCFCSVSSAQSTLWYGVLTQSKILQGKFSVLHYKSTEDFFLLMY